MAAATSMWNPKEKLYAPLMIFGIVLILCLPMFLNPKGIRCADDYRAADWLNDIGHHLTLREGLRTYGEFPLRTHLFGGGYPILGHPSDATLSPASWSFLILPIHIALKLNILILLWIGAFGIYLLARFRLSLKPIYAFFSSAAFTFCGWWLSFALTGFYVQSYYLLTPMILYFLLKPRDSLRSGLYAGLGLLLIFLQAGNGFLAVLHFLILITFFLAAQDSDKNHSSSLALAFAAIIAVSAAISYHAKITWIGSIMVCVGIASLPVFWRPARKLAIAWKPYLIRLSIACAVVVFVGCAKWIPMTDLLDKAQYAHHDLFAQGDAYQFGPGERTDRRFYSSLPAFLGHINKPLSARTNYTYGFPDEEEYAPLGVSYGVAIAFALVVVFRWTSYSPWFAAWLFYLLICFGPTLPTDPYRSLIWGLPGFSKFFDPFKYFNFFLVLPMTIAFGSAAAMVVKKFGKARIWHGIFALLLCWPLLQSLPLMWTLFEKPDSALAPRESFHQIHHLEKAEDLRLDYRQIQEKNLGLLRNERGRAESATGFNNLRRGVGVIDWYADLLLPENALPKLFVLPDGTQLPNPSYLGEAWCLDDACRIKDFQITMNTVKITFAASSETTLVVNQNYDPDFVSGFGKPLDYKGLLSIQVPGEGDYVAELKYKPTKVFAGFAVSTASLIVCFLLLAFARKKERSES